MMPRLLAVNIPFKNIIEKLASLKLTIVCLFLLGICTVAGTLYQVDHGLYEAQQEVFFSWFFLLGGFIPIPGVRLVLWVFFINLVSYLIIRFKYRWSNIGLFIIHFGLLLLFVGGFVKFHFGQESQVTLKEGEQSGKGLPITVKLIDVKRELHSRTEMAKHYESRIEVTDKNLTREVVIAMNKPFRYDDYTFFQSGYAIDEHGHEQTTLAVSKNPGRLLPYIASLMMVVGMGIHFLLMLLINGKREKGNGK